MTLKEKLGPALIELLPILPILVPLAGHFVLVNFAMLASMVQDEVDYKAADKQFFIWLPLTYIFSNIFFFYVGFWSIKDKDSILPVVIFIFIVFVSGLNDIIMLGTAFSYAESASTDIGYTYGRTWRFSAGMMIINLLGKPFTIVLSIASIYFRTGANIPGLPIIARGPSRGAYEPVGNNNNNEENN